jgi:hypothetical protein
MRSIILILLWLVAASVHTNPDAGQPRTVFGVRIGLTSNSQTEEFVAVRYNAYGQMREKKVLQRDDLIRVLSGYWPSPFNPDRTDYFAKYGIFGGVYEDSTTLEKIPYCPALDSLWKIKFSMYPFKGTNETGWAGGLYNPSGPQKNYLKKRYGVEHLDLEFFADTSFWNLLHDVTDSTWIENYRFL